MTKCVIQDCEGKKYKRGWCNRHYERWRYHGDPLAGGPPLRKYKPGETCEIDGCNEVPIGRGWCSAHYQSWKKFGDPTKAKWRWSEHRKEWHIGAQGYVQKYDPTNPNAGSSGHVYQHRQVIADIIGRKLLPTENIHHKNGNRADNEPHNLELWISAQPSGQRVQDLVEWARKIIDEYGAIAARIAT
jgi:hypothetical protein